MPGSPMKSSSESPIRMVRASAVSTRFVPLQARLWVGVGVGDQMRGGHFHARGQSPDVQVVGFVDSRMSIEGSVDPGDVDTFRCLLEQDADRVSAGGAGGLSR